jgi:ferredoxin-NADP reductase
MEGASGDDWISVAQSMRAYLRFSLLGGVLAEQIRRLGWSARVHSVLDGDVLQPPLLLLSGLGEVSRIGEVILNPFLGPRLKSGTVTTDLPLAHDRPVDFGLQRFCEQLPQVRARVPLGRHHRRAQGGLQRLRDLEERRREMRALPHHQRRRRHVRALHEDLPLEPEGLLADQAWRHMAMRAARRRALLARLDDCARPRSHQPGQDLVVGHRARPRQRPLCACPRHPQARAAARPEGRPGVAVAGRLPRRRDAAPMAGGAPGGPRSRPGALPGAAVSPAQYRARLARGDTEGLVPAFTMPAGEPPVFPVRLAAREDSDADVARYCFEAVEGGELPPFEAGAHVDVVIAPEYLRPYSLAGDPADRRRWVLAVQREAPAAGGRGGSALMHRSFRPGRRVFVSPPRNHFALDESAREVLLLAGGIGLTPLVAMAHRLHAIGTPFALHVSARQRGQVALAGDLGAAPWAPRVHWHLSGEGRRAELTALLPRWSAGLQLYCCGSARYMDAVFAAARAAGWPDEALHREYFQVPEAPAREDLPFEIVLAGSGRRIAVAAGQRATDALAAAGVAVPTKCSDGLCGVCALPYDADASGEVDHRDHVLGAAARRERVVLCCSRMAQAGARLVLKT